jgi:hypothetical protein
MDFCRNPKGRTELQKEDGLAFNGMCMGCSRPML